MSVFDQLMHLLAERRQRRQRYAETLEILGLPPEIQKDILRPEDDQVGATQARPRPAPAGCEMAR